MAIEGYEETAVVMHDSLGHADTCEPMTHVIQSHECSRRMLRVKTSLVLPRINVAMRYCILYVNYVFPYRANVTNDLIQCLSGLNLSHTLCRKDFGSPNKSSSSSFPISIS